LHVVWQDDRSGSNDIYYNYSTNAGKDWAEDTRLNDWSFSSERPFIAVSDTVLHVIWFDYRDANYEIYYKRNPPGNNFGIKDDLVKNARGQVSIYPNPASRQLTVGSSQFAVPSSQAAVRLSIVDLYGREIKGFPDISSFPYTMDISGLRNGLYFLRVTGEEGETGSAKFLKMAE